MVYLLSMPSLIKPESELSEAGKKKRAVVRVLREKVYALLGGECVCCHEKREVFLTVDHILNNGAYERNKLCQFNQDTMYRRVLKNWTQYQLLCRNCNWAKRFGVCPHF